MSYVKKDVKIPRMAGNSLRAFVAALDVPGLGAALRQSMMANLGINELRRRPTLAPQWTPTRLIAGIPRSSASAAASGPAPDLDRAAGLSSSSSASSASGPLTIADYARAYRSGSASPIDVAERLLTATAESNAHKPPLRAIIAQDVDDVRALATASALRHKEKKPLSVLDGVPVAIKDEVDQRGYGTSAGTRFYGRERAAEDSFAVKKLRDAGALLIGKANMHELGIGTTGLNPHHGTARNPWNLSRHTGGSSSGSGAAVAAGLCPVALGADGGGSIRNPASLCGLVGLKPTFGRVSEHGAAPICWSVAHIGPLGATARDVAVAYAVMAGPDEREPQTLFQPPVELPDFSDAQTGNLKGVRLGVYRPWFEDADADVVKACWEGMKRLEKLGATLKDIEIPDLDLVRIVHLVTIGVEMAVSQASVWDDHKDDYALDSRINFSLARNLDAMDYVHAQRHRTTVCDHFDRILQSVDAICTPSVGCVAPRIRQDALVTCESDLALLLKIMRFAPAANVTGLPAIGFPAGVGEEGMPAGLMAMGRAFDEALLLRLAAANEREYPARAPSHTTTSKHWRLLP